jgi:NAD-dependent SIR2 family protein deacetylase
MKIKNFDCQQCDEKFSQKNSLLAHLCAAHGRPYPHECPDCGRKFPHRSSYVVHRASHEKELCPICGKGISGGRAFLRKHIEGFHDRKANIKCDHCEETFLDRSKLYRHEARVHGVRGKNSGFFSF